MRKRIALILAALFLAVPVLMGAGRGPVESYRPNQWYGPENTYFSTTGLQDSGVFDLFPRRVRTPARITGLAVGVVQPGSSGSMVRTFVYADNGQDYPGTLLLDSGATSATTAGVKEFNGFDLLIPGNGEEVLLWISGGAQGQPAIRPRMAWFGQGTYFPEMSHGLPAYFVHNGCPPNGYVMGGVENLPPETAPQGMGRTCGAVRVAIKFGTP